MAIGRSYAGPSFRKSAGARLTVIRLIGNKQPLFLIAERTRSRDSFSGIGETNDGECLQAIGDINFNFDKRSVQSDYCAALYLCQHERQTSSTNMSSIMHESSEKSKMFVLPIMNFYD